MDEPLEMPCRQAGTRLSDPGMQCRPPALAKVVRQVATAMPPSAVSVGWRRGVVVSGVRR